VVSLRRVVTGRMNITAVEYILLALTATAECFAGSVTPTVKLRLARFSYSTYLRYPLVVDLVESYGHEEDC